MGILGFVYIFAIFVMYFNKRYLHSIIFAIALGVLPFVLMIVSVI